MGGGRSSRIISDSFASKPASSVGRTKALNQLNIMVDRDSFKKATTIKFNTIYDSSLLALASRLEFAGYTDKKHRPITIVAATKPASALMGNKIALFQEKKGMLVINMAKYKTTKTAQKEIERELLKAFPDYKNRYYSAAQKVAKSNKNKSKKTAAKNSKPAAKKTAKKAVSKSSTKKTKKNISDKK